MKVEAGDEKSVYVTHWMGLCYSAVLDPLQHSIQQALLPLHASSHLFTGGLF